MLTLTRRRPGSGCISVLGAVKSAKNYMAKTDNPRGIAKVARELKKKTPLLEQLQPSEAALVLRRLLAGHPELLPEAEEIARSTLGEVSFESIASEVEDSIRQLSLDDLDGHAGRYSLGVYRADRSCLAVAGRGGGTVRGRHETPLGSRAP